MTFHGKKQVCIILILVLLLLAAISLFNKKNEQPGEKYITDEEAAYVIGLLDEAAQDNGPVSDEFRESVEELMGMTSSLSRSDWYLYFDELCKQVDTKGRIATRTLVILGDADTVTDGEGNPLARDQVCSDQGVWEVNLASDQNLNQKAGCFLTVDRTIRAVISLEEEAKVENVWLIEDTGENLSYFYQNYEIKSTKNGLSGAEEQVADLYFTQGELTGIEVKSERITGEVLKISDSEVEIKGQGTFSISPQAQVYRLYDQLKTVEKNEVRLGYSFTDFVLSEGVVQAGLLVRDEQMESIRVLLKSSDYESSYHEEIQIVCDVDMELVYGEETEVVPAGEVLTLTPDSTYFTCSRIYLNPTALTGSCRFPNIRRSQTDQGYAGSFEIEKREEGLVLINEVLLEEYLYAVVPSEMPGYYPLEALKAQAVCARTYAYSKLLHSSLGYLGANLDDSSTYQVYHNIQKNTNATKAVRETRGQLLFADDTPADTYYYSTSWGFGTDASLWNNSGANSIPYLTAREIALEEGDAEPEELTEEETFREAMNNSFANQVENEEPWYRWTYTHGNLEAVAQKVKQQKEKDPSHVLYAPSGTEYTTEALPDSFTIEDVQVKERGVGGTVEKLLLITDKGNILVEKEFNVRTVLTDGQSQVTLNDGTVYSCKNLLPSAFFYPELTVSSLGERVLTLHGGGFGHGVGMSQNGAKNLANLGKNCEEILTFFYQGCSVQRAY